MNLVEIYEILYKVQICLVGFRCCVSDGKPQKGSWARLRPFDSIFSAKYFIFRSEYAQLLRICYFIGKS